MFGCAYFINQLVVLGGDFKEEIEIICFLEFFSFFPFHFSNYYKQSIKKSISKQDSLKNYYVYLTFLLYRIVLQLMQRLHIFQHILWLLEARMILNQTISDYFLRFKK